MRNMSLLKGNIQKELICLTIPLLLSNILQQLYNTADSLIVARFLGHQAFASTGISGALMNLLIFVLNGFCVGISVIFAQAYGSGDKQAFRQSFFHALTAGTVLTILLSVLTGLSLGPLLSLIHTPAELIRYCESYITVILAALPATYLYNLFASVLRSVGDTRSSLYFLAFSAAANIFLDLLLVGAADAGISGAAYATAAAQLLAAFLCFLYLRSRYPDLLCRRSDASFRLSSLFKLMQFGLVSALHQSSLYIGKLLVQGTVNTLGTAGIAAYTAATRIEGIVNSFGDSGSQALTIFTSQNYGAGEQDRISQGFQKGFILLLMLGGTASVLLFLTASDCLRLFLDNTDAVSTSYGLSYLRIVAVFYVLCFIGNVFLGCFRGVGMITVSFWGTTLHLALRVFLSWRLISRLGLSAVALATGAGWVLVVAYYAAVSLICRARLRKRNGYSSSSSLFFLRL